MSGSIGSIGYGILPSLIANAGTVHAQLNTLTEQISTGLIAQTYAGLGAGASLSLSLGPQVSTLQTYANNINQVTGQMQVAQTALGQIQQIAQTFVGDMPNLNGLNPSEVDSIASNARSALQQVTNLLDTQDAGVYVFGGQDSANPPVPNPDQILSSGFFTQINSAVSALSTNGATATAAATQAIARSNAAGTSPFSAYMSQSATALAAPVVQAGPNSFVSVGLFASANTAAVSGGSSTTGSYIRDLMRSLATLGSLTSSQVNDPNFAPLVQDTASSLNSAVSAMATDAGVLGDRQAQLTGQQTQLGAMTTALSGQVSTAQNVDIATAISQLTSVQVQLQESYRLIVNSATLSLVNYVPA